MISAPDTFATKGDATRFLALVEADMARGQYLDPSCRAYDPRHVGRHLA